MDNELVLWCGVGSVLVFIWLFAYFYFKGKENAKYIHRYENSIENLNKEIFELQKKFKEQKEYLEVLEKELQDLNTLLQESPNNPTKEFPNLIREEEYIIALYQKGWDIDLISTELYVDRNIVESILRSNNLI